jgi:hypothetical protein
MAELWELVELLASYLRLVPAEGALSLAFIIFIWIITCPDVLSSVVLYPQGTGYSLSIPTDDCRIASWTWNKAWFRMHKWTRGMWIRSFVFTLHCCHDIFHDCRIYSVLYLFTWWFAMNQFTALVSGLIFGFGLILSGID